MFFGGCSMSRNCELMRVPRDAELAERLDSGMGRIPAPALSSSRFLSSVRRSESSAAATESAAV